MSKLLLPWEFQSSRKECNGPVHRRAKTAWRNDNDNSSYPAEVGTGTVSHTFYRKNHQLASKIWVPFSFPVHPRVRAGLYLKSKLWEIRSDHTEKTER